MKVAVNIRMPKEMKLVLDRIATRKFTSLNSIILQFLDENMQRRGIDWRSEGKTGKNRE
jgi:hypothetical protein